MILFLINPMFLALFSVKLSFGPLTTFSLEASVTPLSRVDLVSINIASLLPSIKIHVYPEAKKVNISSILLEVVK